MKVSPRKVSEVRAKFFGRNAIYACSVTIIIEIKEIHFFEFVERGMRYLRAQHRQNICMELMVTVFDLSLRTGWQTALSLARVANFQDMENVHSIPGHGPIGKIQDPNAINRLTNGHYSDNQLPLIF